MTNSIVHAADSGSLLRMVAVDPGEVYVGYAYFVGPQVIDVEVFSPEQAIDRIWSQLDNQQVDVCVAEQWRNFDERVTWSECRTVEVLGAISHKCRQRGVPLVRQPSTLLRPGRGRMRAHGVVFPDLSHIPAKDRNHVESALTHGWWYRFEQGSYPMNQPHPGA